MSGVPASVPTRGLSASRSLGRHSRRTDSAVPRRATSVATGSPCARRSAPRGERASPRAAGDPRHAARGRATARPVPRQGPAASPQRGRRPGRRAQRPQPSSGGSGLADADHERPASPATSTSPARSLGHHAWHAPGGSGRWRRPVATRSSARQQGHVTPVEPAEPRRVVHRSGPRDARQVERLSEVSRVHYLATGRIRPAEQRQVVHDSVGQVPLFPQRGHRLGSTRLRQRPAVRAHDERNVRVARRNGAERLEEQQLPRRVREMIVAADHEGDAHRRVVHGAREVVESGSIGPRDQEVADVRGPEPDRTVDLVVHDDFARSGPTAKRQQCGLRVSARPPLPVAHERGSPRGSGANARPRHPSRAPARACLRRRSSGRRDRPPSGGREPRRTGRPGPTGDTGRAVPRCRDPRPTPDRATRGPR